MFQGGVYNRNQRKDILKKWDRKTVEGNKEAGFGVPHHGRSIRRVRRGSGELITDKHAPPQTELERRRSPHRREARKARSYIGQSLDLNRELLLLDHHAESS